MATASSAGAAAKPAFACPVGFGTPLTVEEAIRTPLFQESIEAGLITEAEIRAGFASFDLNANGLLCLKHPEGFLLPHPYLVFDQLPASDG
jgi:hypothetical protein